MLGTLDCIFKVCNESLNFIATSLFQAGRNVRDLFEDLRDGHNLLSLLEVLSGEILVCHKNKNHVCSNAENLGLSKVTRGVKEN